MRQHPHIKLYIIYIMRLLYILFYTASLQISAIIIFTTCLLSYAIPIIMRLNHEIFTPQSIIFCFSLKIYFLSFYLSALIRRKPPFSGGFLLRLVLRVKRFLFSWARVIGNGKPTRLPFGSIARTSAFSRVWNRILSPKQRPNQRSLKSIDISESGCIMNAEGLAYERFRTKYSQIF